jgi:ketosteroid isomerase-like protein
MKKILIPIALLLFVICSGATAQAQKSKTDETMLRDLISRADREPNVIKRTDDTIFVSGALARPLVGKQERAAMQSKMGEVNQQRINQIQKTELVRLVIAKSKDMAYDFGNFTLSYDTPDKKHVEFTGSYLRIWRKVKGEWMTEAFFARPNEEPATTAKNK